jgi:hypothetical protein
MFKHVQTVWVVFSQVRWDVLNGHEQYQVKRWDKIRFINWMSGSWGFCKVLSLHPQTVCRSVVNVAYRKDFVVHSSWLKVMTMKIPSSLRVIFPCCLSRMEAVRDKWMIPIRGACKVPKDPDRQNWMTDEVGFWNLHRLTMTATSFFWGDNDMAELWHFGPQIFWAMMHVPLCSHLATQQCQVCPSPLTYSPCSNLKVMSATPTSYSSPSHQWLCNRWTGTHKKGELKQDFVAWIQ